MNESEAHAIKIAAVIIVGVLLTVFAFYLSYRTAQRAGNAIVLPNGATYVGVTPTP